ncbi:MAG: acylneuraminate cytidylyltransferase family protein [Helicobacter sp.]|nr:acylneuraminate cytidylyltransferase family protein [Helicobacter sp.]
MKKVVAVVPVKQNSSRLANKNILPFAGSTLLEYKINQLKQVESLSEIIVSSDSDDMLKMALRQGVSVDRRPLCYANESRPFGEFVEYLADMIIEKCGVESHLLWACCTSPLVSVKRYKEAISLYFKYLGEFDSLISVYKWRHYMFDKAGPMNFKRGAGHVNSQELPAFDLFTCGILLCPIVKAKEWKYNFGLKPYRFELNQVESVDIDTEFDYYCALAGLEMMRDKGIVESQNANPQTVNRSSHSVTGGGG